MIYKLTEQELLDKGYRKYYGEEIDVYFNLDICQHSGICTMTLPDVFDLKRKPWILPDAKPKQAVADMIVTCPSGALQYIFKEDLLNFEITDNKVVAVCHQEQVGVLDYRELKNDLYQIDNVQVAYEVRGQDIGQQMLHRLVEYAQTNHLKLVSNCPFVDKEIEKHPEYNDVFESK